MDECFFCHDQTMIGIPRVLTSEPPHIEVTFCWDCEGKLRKMEKGLAHNTTGG